MSTTGTSVWQVCVNSAKHACPNPSPKPQTRTCITSLGDVMGLGTECISLEKGNTVLCNKFGIGCTDLEMNDDSYIVIKEQDLIGTFPGSGATAADIPKMQPLGDRILIKPMEVSNTSAGGIMRTAGAMERPSTATVIAAGPGKKGEDGELVPMTIKKGDKVMFFKYAGDKMYDTEGMEYIVVREMDILATM